MTDKTLKQLLAEKAKLEQDYKDINAAASNIEKQIKERIKPLVAARNTLVEAKLHKILEEEELFWRGQGLTLDNLRVWKPVGYGRSFTELGADIKVYTSLAGIHFSLEEGKL